MYYSLTHFTGCDGGLSSWAYEYLIKSKKGLATEKEYPYLGKSNGTCHETAAMTRSIPMTNWTKVSKDEDQMAAYLEKHGPMACGVNAALMNMVRCTRYSMPRFFVFFSARARACVRVYVADICFHCLFVLLFAQVLHIQRTHTLLA